MKCAGIRFVRSKESTSNGIGMIVFAAIAFAAMPENFQAYKRNAVSVLAPGTEQEYQYKREIEGLFRGLKPAHMVGLLGQAETCEDDNEVEQLRAEVERLSRLLAEATTP
jgi:hypothetical protein